MTSVPLVVVVFGVVSQRAITVASAMPARRPPMIKPRQSGDFGEKHRINLLAVEVDLIDSLFVL